MPSRSRRAAVVLVTLVAAVTLMSAPAGVALSGPSTGATGAAGAATSGGTAARDGGWVAGPAPGGGTRPSADDRAYFYLEGRPGAVLEDAMAVANTGDRPRTVELRGADADNTRSGAFAVRPPGQSTDTGAWVSLVRAEVGIPARTRAEIPFTVTVPPDAVPGDHPGAIVVSGGGREAVTRIHLRVTGPTLSALSVEDVSVAEAGSGALIRYALVNRGNTVLTPRLAVRAEGLFGEVLRRDARALPLELLPGQRVRLTEKWPGPPELDAVDITLTARAAGGAHGAATTSYAAVPWFAAGLLLLVPGAGAGAWCAWRVRRRRRAASTADGGPDRGRDADRRRDPYREPDPALDRNPVPGQVRGGNQDGQDGRETRQLSGTGAGAAT
ncbi:COG1470 family protein [Streptomyces sp. KR80]|uniref:COG1470 family protein n=1 Tax=Streptomyces sp. KR80 TaxID=3457426 RepID=UPI003FD0036E